MGINSRYFEPYEFFKLDQARGIAQVPFVLTSAWRCHAHNTAVGGKITSAHIYGMAVDIACSNSRDRFRIIYALIQVGFTRIGIGKDFIHADIDGTKDAEVVWLY